MEEEQTVKISELESAVSINNADIIPIVQNGDTKKTSFELLKDTAIDDVGFEIGSTSAGQYIKYNNGIVIQYGKVWLNPDETRSAGGLTYYSKGSDVTLPVELYSTSGAVCYSNVEIANMNYFTSGCVVFVDNSTIRVSLANTGQNDERYVDWMVIGRWK